MTIKSTFLSLCLQGMCFIKIRVYSNYAHNGPLKNTRVSIKVHLVRIHCRPTSVQTMHKVDLYKTPPSYYHKHYFPSPSSARAVFYKRPPCAQ